MKKALSIVLLASILCSVSLTACSGKETVPDDPATNVPASETTAETEAETEPETELTDGLPEDLNFDGRELRLLSVDYLVYGSHTLITVEEQTGDLLNDAVYNRDLTIRDRFNITISETSMGTDFNKINSMVREMVASGDDAYDLAGSCDRDSFALAIEGNAYAMDELPYVNLENPWWSQKQNDSLTFGGKHYIAYNDFMISGLDATDVMVFNKTVEQNFGLDIYTLVEDGKWTWDKLGEYGLMVTSDTDGNGTWDANDNYGWVIGMKNVPSTVWVSGGAMAVTKDENDLPVFAQGDMERFYNCLEMAYNVSWNDIFWYGRQAAWSVDNITDPPLFATDKALFMSCGLGTLSSAYFREMESNYGIIPQPKYSEDQAEYRTRTQGGFVHVVPTSCRDTEFVGAMMEALACESLKSVKPAYYEVALKEKFSRDEQSGRVLDLLIESRVSDYADTILRSYIVDGFILTKAQTGNPIQASDIEANRKVVEAQIKKFTKQHETRFRE